MKSVSNSMKRTPEYDIAKGIAIMGVMMVHLASEYQLITYGIAFHIVTFFAVSGILERESVSLRDSILKKLRSLLYPYCTMSLIYIVFYSIVRIVKEGQFPIRFIVGNLYLTLSGSGIGTLWFLPAALIGAVIYAIIKDKFPGKAPGILIALMVICVIVGRVLYETGVFGSVHYTVEGIFTNELQVLFKGSIAAGFMQLGRCIWQGLRFMKNKLKEPIFYLGGGGIWILYLISYKLYKGNDLHYIKITSVLGFLIATILGVAAVLFLSMVIAKIPVITNIFQYFGRNSLIVFTTHLEYKVVGIVPLIVVSLGLGVILQNMLIFVLVCVIEAVICLVVRRTPLKNIFYYPMKPKAGKDLDK